MSFKFSGLNSAQKAFNKKMKQVKRYTEQGLQDAAEHLLNKALPLVPVDTGRLQRSGVVTADGPKKRYVSFEAHDPNTGYEYAPIQHENLSFNHKVGQAKYLEEPFVQETDAMIKIIADSVEKGLK